QRVGGSGKGADLLPARPFTLRTGRAHARLEILLADIQSGAPLVQKFHRNPSGHKRTRLKRARPEEPQGSEESDPRALGNNRQLLSVAPNPMLTDELTAARKLRGPGRTRFPFSRLHGGPPARPGMLIGKIADVGGQAEAAEQSVAAPDDDRGRPRGRP